MTPSLVIRSALALLLGVLLAGLALTHAGIPPTSAITAAVSDQGPSVSGTVMPTPPPLIVPRRNQHGSGPPAVPTAGPVAIPPGLYYQYSPYVPGHILFDNLGHNICFIGGHHLRACMTGDNSSVAPALSPDGRSLAWVELKRNSSDLFVTTLRWRRDGSVVAMTTTQLTQDAAPPPGLQLVPAPAGIYDPRYLWWANKPAWLPDGRHLLYLSDRPGYNPQFEENATMAVWEQGLTDTITDAVQLTTPTAGTGGHDSAQWRPHDPALFIYVNYYSGPDLPSGEGVIQAALAPTGTAPTAPPIALSPHGATEYQPAWSPDGHYIAFVEDKGHARSNLLVMPFHRPGQPLDYYHAVTIARGSPYVVQPFWSPDGHYLGYLASSGGNFSLVIQRVQLGRRPRAVGPPITIPQAGAVSADYRPTWGP